MNKIAFIWGSHFLYWNSLLLVLSVSVGILLLFALYLERGGTAITVAAFTPMAILLSIGLARLIHWYCLPIQYQGLRSAFTNLSGGGYALVGCFLGCLLSALIMRVLHFEVRLLRLLDCLSIAGCTAISLGRLSFFYTSADRGMIVPMKSLPWACAVYNEISHAAEYRLATFLIQAILVGLLAVWLWMQFHGRKTLPEGDITRVFLLFYSLIAVVTDSTRYDSIYFRSNGFISVVQILAALTLLGVLIYYAVAAFCNGGIESWYPVMWVLLAVLLGGAGFMEYYVQRHGRQAPFAYSLMCVCLTELAVVAMILRTQSLRRWRLTYVPLEDEFFDPDADPVYEEWEAEEDTF